METNKATINRNDDSKSLILHVNEQEFSIALTDENPNTIKSVFNKLLLELKQGLFEFELIDDKQDLYHHICAEYLTQLNLELKSVYQELEDYDLLVLGENN